MAENTETENENKGNPPQGGSNKILIIIIAVLVLIIAGLGGLFFLNSNKSSSASTNQSSTSTSSENRLKLSFLQLPELLINLRTLHGKDAILRASFTLQLSSENDTEIIKQYIPLIVDQFQTFLREMNVADIQGASGIERIRQELLIRINQLVKPHKILEILVKDFLVQ